MNVILLWTILISNIFRFGSNTENTIVKSYTVYYHNKEVGYTNIKGEMINGMTKYSIKSETDVQIIRKNVVITEGDSYYKDGSFYKGTTLITVNDEPYSKSETSRNNQDELKFTYNDEPTSIEKVIDKTTFWLYLNEPVNVHEIFVEFKGVFKSVEEVPANNGLKAYKVRSKDSNISHSTYFYAQGELVKIETKEGPVTFTLKLNEE